MDEIVLRRWHIDLLDAEIPIALRLPRFDIVGCSLCGDPGVVVVIDLTTERTIVVILVSPNHHIKEARSYDNEFQS
jgi:hypothetical protein